MFQGVTHYTTNGMGRKNGRKEGGLQEDQKIEKLLDWMIKEMDNRTLYEQLKKLAMDRRQWRTWSLSNCLRTEHSKKKKSDITK